MKNPEKIYHVSQAQLSLARHYGGCRYNGMEYFYNPIDDTLTRADILKQQTKKAKDEPPIQISL